MHGKELLRTSGSPGEPRKAPGPRYNPGAPVTSHAARGRPFAAAPGRGLSPEAPRTGLETEPARSRGTH